MERLSHGVQKNLESDSRKEALGHADFTGTVCRTHGPALIVATTVITASMLSDVHVMQGGVALVLHTLGRRMCE